MLIDDQTRVLDYDSSKIAENSPRPTRSTSSTARHPVDRGAPKNVIFLTADAYGVMPPVPKLTREQAMYYFINGYTSKLAGTELGVTEPQPNFSACFGAPFLPPAKVYAEMLAAKVKKHDASVWLLNTGWTSGPYGTGQRSSLKVHLAFVTAILNGTLKNAKFTPDPVFGLPCPDKVEGVPSEVLNPRNTWKDGAAYDAKARTWQAKFRANDAKFDMPTEVRARRPQGAERSGRSPGPFEFMSRVEPGDLNTRVCLRSARGPLRLRPMPHSAPGPPRSRRRPACWESTSTSERPWPHRCLLGLQGLEPAELRELLLTARGAEVSPDRSRKSPRLRGKVVANLFSARTRLDALSFTARGPAPQLPTSSTSPCRGRASLKGESVTDTG